MNSEAPGTSAAIGFGYRDFAWLRGQGTRLNAPRVAQNRLRDVARRATRFAIGTAGDRRPEMARRCPIGAAIARALGMSVAPFPHRYTTTLVNDTLFAAPRVPISIGAPRQFVGTDDVWSPEQLLVSAALSCLKTTFDAYAKREGIVIHDWRGAGTGVLVKGREGPVFESIELDIELDISW